MTGGIVVSQLGARMHYAVPRILHAANRLEHFYTDISATKDWPTLLGAVPSGTLPTAVRRLVGRVPEGIPPERMTTFPGFGLRSALRRLRSRTAAEEMSHALWAGHRFSRLVVGNGFHGAAGLYAFTGEALEQLVAARSQGLWTVVEQTNAPRIVINRLIMEEEERFPDWQIPTARNPFAPAFIDRELTEWSFADLVVCPSEFVRRTVVENGAEPRRCVVVPYGVDARFAVDERRRSTGPLRVLTVGEVGLRKGSPHVLGAARRIGRHAVFRMVGPCNVLESARAELARVVELTGPVPRGEMLRQFAWADIFLLPSICEGSATVVYEALAAGLPVICTENTGSVVRDGVDGFLVPMRDAEAIATAIERLGADPALRATMAENARARAADFTLERYGERLLAALAALSPRPRLRPVVPTGADVLDRSCVA